ncbi:MAG: hypothetical protein EB127_12555 [Alphaproteobacteria bacterium]|nr:hypothetical protein [Alphaproteobacteria bacterium]
MSTYDSTLGGLEPTDTLSYMQPSTTLSGIQNTTISTSILDNINSRISPNPPVITEPISNICFLAGTPVVTNQGTVAIDKLNPLVHTIRNKKIIAVTKTITQDKSLICFEKDALGTNFPSERTVITKNHLIMHKGKMVQAKSLLGLSDKIHKVAYNGEVLYNVLMEEHNRMIVNNLICETLHPENSIAKLYMVMMNMNEQDKQSLIKYVNNVAIKKNIYKPRKM